MCCGTGNKHCGNRGRKQALHHGVLPKGNFVVVSL